MKEKGKTSSSMENSIVKYKIVCYNITLISKRASNR